MSVTLGVAISIACRYISLRPNVPSLELLNYRVTARGCTINFGTVDQSRDQNVTFYLRNGNNANLKLAGDGVNCGCSDVQAPASFPPNSTSKIIFAYHPSLFHGFIDEQARLVIVGYERSPPYLRITSNVIKTNSVPQITRRIHAILDSFKFSK